jgi:hypothetical protein
MAAECEIAVFGLSTMGQNLALNIAEHGHKVAVCNRSPGKVRRLALICVTVDGRGRGLVEAHVAAATAAQRIASRPAQAYSRIAKDDKERSSRTQGLRFVLFGAAFILLAVALGVRLAHFRRRRASCSPLDGYLPGPGIVAGRHTVVGEFFRGTPRYADDRPAFFQVAIPPRSPPFPLSPFPSLPILSRFRRAFRSPPSLHLPRLPFPPRPSQVDETVRRAADEGNLPLHGFKDVGEFVAAIRKPRAVIILVQAGKPVDDTIEILSQ